LSTLVPSHQRSTIFAWYAVFSGLAGAIGSLSAGWITTYLRTGLRLSETSAYRSIFAIYAVLGLVKGVLTLQLSERCDTINTQNASLSDEVRLEQERSILEEAPEQGLADRPQKAKNRVLGLTAETRVKVRVLGLLFGLDNIASGLVPL
jgi:MFS family permease